VFQFGIPGSVVDWSLPKWLDVFFLAGWKQKTGPWDTFFGIVRANCCIIPERPAWGERAGRPLYLEVTRQMSRFSFIAV